MSNSGKRNPGRNAFDWFDGHDGLVLDFDFIAARLGTIPANEHKRQPPGNDGVVIDANAQRHRDSAVSPSPAIAVDATSQRLMAEQFFSDTRRTGSLH
ncbi:MAG: hypothetical protein ACRYF5_00630 [Janthinobacterium lividum]